jgi:hypothetical protein
MHQPQNQVLFFFVLSLYKFTVIFVVLQMFFGFECSYSMTTIKSLREIAHALDMQLVYGFVPNDGSLDALIEKRATELATKIVLRTNNTMKLEDQGNTNERIKKAIKERADEIKNEMPKILWD